MGSPASAGKMARPTHRRDVTTPWWASPWQPRHRCRGIAHGRVCHPAAGRGDARTCDSPLDCAGATHRVEGHRDGSRRRRRRTGRTSARRSTAERIGSIEAQLSSRIRSASARNNEVGDQATFDIGALELTRSERPARSPQHAAVRRDVDSSGLHSSGIDSASVRMQRLPWRHRANSKQFQAKRKTG